MALECFAIDVTISDLWGQYGSQPHDYENLRRQALEERALQQQLDEGASRRELIRRPSPGWGRRLKVSM